MALTQATRPISYRADLERLARANLLAEPQLFGFGVALETPVAAGATKRPAPYVYIRRQACETRY